MVLITGGGGGGGGLDYVIRGGGLFMITVDDGGGGEGGKNCQNIDYVICERPPMCKTDYEGGGGVKMFQKLIT